jgi:hypothetical protein
MCRATWLPGFWLPGFWRQERLAAGAPGPWCQTGHGAAA